MELIWELEYVKEEVKQTDKHDVICEIMNMLSTLKSNAEYEKKASEEYLEGIEDSIKEIKNYRKQGKWMC